MVELNGFLLPCCVYFVVAINFDPRRLDSPLSMLSTALASTCICRMPTWPHIPYFCSGHRYSFLAYVSLKLMSNEWYKMCSRYVSRQNFAKVNNLVKLLRSAPILRDSPVYLKPTVRRVNLNATAAVITIKPQLSEEHHSNQTSYKVN